MTEMSELNNGVVQVSGAGSTPVSGSSFDKKASQALKGIAILMLMLHHSFRSSELFKNYDMSFSLFRNIK